MNWAMVKALNSTVGTPEFKPLDVLIGEKVGNLSGCLYDIGFKWKSFSYNDAEIIPLGVTIQGDKWYCADLGFVYSTPNGYSTTRTVRTNAFRLGDSNARSTTSIVVNENAEVVITNKFLTIVADFLKSKDGELNVMFYCVSMLGTVVVPSSLVLVIEKIYEVI